jgi:hypothetical protein
MAISSVTKVKIYFCGQALDKTKREKEKKKKTRGWQRKNNEK